MQFPNKKREQLAFLTALTLLFSYIEMILPRFVPFFRLGLANIVILLSLELDFGLFFLLAVFKAVASSLMGGTLFSPFFIISLVQSLLSALAMRGASKLLSKKLISLYGISVFGSAVSALVQICLSSLYLGRGTFGLLGPMLLFNVASGLIVAFLAGSSKVKDFIEKMNQSHLLLQNDCEVVEPEKKSFLQQKRFIQISFVLLLLAFSASLFFVKNIIILTLAFIAGLILQKICGRKIFLLPHISLWLFIFFTALFIPNGQVLFKIWKISVTRGAILLALRKALTLSAVSALSQCAVCLKPRENTLLALILDYYRLMSDTFRESYKGFTKSFKPSE
ncbi:MAG: Gx transporter family protein [Treponema sp.]|nr:Gx transporter family protein [Treponema sp.]